MRSVEVTLEKALHRGMCAGAGASLHVCMTPHGPDAATFEAASSRDTSRPERLPTDTLAFMFEASVPSSSPGYPMNTPHHSSSPGHPALHLTWLPSEPKPPFCLYSCWLSSCVLAPMPCRAALSVKGVCRMWQVHHVPKVRRAALASQQLDADYYKCWSGLRSHFTASALCDDGQEHAAAGLQGAPHSNGSS
jgi:hypothetical protein